ncbi:MAG: hypothetical protein RIC55_11390 [Pirellulaceae bacterium]
MTVLAEIQQRAVRDEVFCNEIRTALDQGGLPAAADAARAHGFDVPLIEADGEELSDLELELIAGGKATVLAWVSAPLWLPLLLRAPSSVF